MINLIQDQFIALEELKKASKARIKEEKKSKPPLEKKVEEIETAE